MKMQNLETGNGLQKTPERLVLEGYRRWSAGFKNRSIVPWEMAWELYSDTLGEADASIAIAGLSRYVRSLNRCANCPLRSYPYNSNQLCVEECMTVGLISGLQHNSEAAGVCLEHFRCFQKRNQLEEAASNYACILKSLGQILQPVSHVKLDAMLSIAK